MVSIFLKIATLNSIQPTKGFADTYGVIKRAPKITAIFIVTLFYLGTLPVELYAGDNINLILLGTTKTLFSVLKLPMYMATGAVKQFPIGILGGAIQGSYEAVAGTLSGAVDIARGAAPYAKYLVFL